MVVSENIFKLESAMRLIITNLCDSVVHIFIYNDCGVLDTKKFYMLEYTDKSFTFIQYRE